MWWQSTENSGEWCGFCVIYYLIMQIVLLSSLCAVSLLLLLLLIKPRRSCTVRVIFYESINLGGV